MARPKKGEGNSDIPKTELECQRLQKLFLDPNCPQNIKDEFFLLLRTYARSIALKQIKRTGIYLLPERVDEIATDATLAVMNQYHYQRLTKFNFG